MKFTIMNRNVSIHENTNMYDSTSKSIYYPLKEKQWTGVNRFKVEKTIENLQHRITKATQRGDNKKVRDLQRLLTRTRSGYKLKGVRIVAQENSGKQTPGIDEELLTTAQTPGGT